VIGESPWTGVIIKSVVAMIATGGLSSIVFDVRLGDPLSCR
jgi:hypothetical protein